MLIYRTLQEHISIGVTEAFGITNEDLQWLVEYMIEELSTNTDEFQLISKAELYEMDYPAWEIDYTGNTEQGLAARFKCHSIAYRGRVYVITIGAPGSGLPPSLTDALTSFTISEPSQPEARLIQFQEMKFAQLQQTNTELADIQVEIDAQKIEVEHLNNLIEGAYRRLSEQVGHTVSPDKPISLHQLTTEELLAKFKIGSANSKLYQLQEQEKDLLTNKEYLEQDLVELEHYALLDIYYRYKLSQLDNITFEATVLRVDIDQKVPGAQQKYDELLIKRLLLQQDNEELEQLLGIVEY